MTRHRTAAASIRQGALVAAAGIATGWATVGIAAAAAQDRLTTDISLSAGAATNPFLQPGNTPPTGTVVLEVTPEYTLRSDRTSLQVQGGVRLAEYTRRYPLNDSYSLRGSGTYRVSPTVQIDGGLGYVNSVIGTAADFFMPVGTPIGTTPIGGDTVGGTPVGGIPAIDPIGQPGLVDDPALAGIGRRRSAFSANGGIAVALGRFDQLAARASAAATRFPSGVALDEFKTATAGLSYQRTFSRGLTGAITADATMVDYVGGRLADATIYQPGLSVSRTLDIRWTLTAAVGAALVRINAPGGTTRSSTDINGSVGVCRRDTRWNACLTANRATLPSSIQGVRTQTGLSATGSYRVSDFDDLSVNAAYSHVEAPLVRVVGPTAPVVGTPGTTVPASALSTDFATIGATYARRIGPRLSAFASASATKSDDVFVNRDANIEARLGIRYRIGERR